MLNIFSYVIHLHVIFNVILKGILKQELPVAVMVPWFYRGYSENSVAAFMKNMSVFSINYDEFKSEPSIRIVS